MFAMIESQQAAPGKKREEPAMTRMAMPEDMPMPAGAM